MGPGEVILMVTPTIRNIMGNNVHKKEQREDYIEYAFYQPVLYFSQGFLADAEDGVRCLSFKVHAVTQVVAHIGHAVEMYQVVLAIVDDRHDLFAQCRGQAAVSWFTLCCAR